MGTLAGLGYGKGIVVVILVAPHKGLAHRIT